MFVNQQISLHEIIQELLPESVCQQNCKILKTCATNIFDLQFSLQNCLYQDSDKFPTKKAFIQTFKTNKF